MNSAINWRLYQSMAYSSGMSIKICKRDVSASDKFDEIFDSNMRLKSLRTSFPQIFIFNDILWQKFTSGFLMYEFLVLGHTRKKEKIHQYRRNTFHSLLPETYQSYKYYSNLSVTEMEDIIFLSWESPRQSFKWYKIFPSALRN